MRMFFSSSSRFASSSSFVVSFQTIILESAPPDTKVVPSWCRSSAHTLSLWPSIVASHSLVRIVQSLTRPSAPDDISWRPPPRKRTRRVLAACPWKVRTQLKSDRDQSLTVRSPLHVARTLSNGENWQSQTPLLWPLIVPRRLRSEEFQSFTVLSWLPVATRESLGATLTMLISFSCARTLFRERRLSSSPSFAAAAQASNSDEPGRAQRLRVRSLLAVSAKAPPPFRADLPPTSYRPSFLDNADAPIASVWPVAMATHFPDSTCQSLIVLSLPQLDRYRPQGLTSILSTVSVWPSRTLHEYVPSSKIRIWALLVATATF